MLRTHDGKSSLASSKDSTSAKPSSYVLSILSHLHPTLIDLPHPLNPQRLMSSHTIEDLTSCILDFQANMVRVTYRRKTTVVEPDAEPEHAAALNYVWVNSKVREEVDEDGEVVKWRMLGCQTEDLAVEFGEVGVLGLDCLVSRFAT